MPRGCHNSSAVARPTVMIHCVQVFIVATFVFIGNVGYIIAVLFFLVIIVIFLLLLLIVVVKVNLCGGGRCRRLCRLDTQQGGCFFWNSLVVVWVTKDSSTWKEVVRHDIFHWPVMWDDTGDAARGRPFRRGKV